MVYDSFMMFSNLDLLEIRLEEHWSIVDKFIITEAPLTQSCKPKPMHYELNRDRFEKYWDKIVYLKMTEARFDLHKHFQNERLQRNHFRLFIDYKEDDIFILSDSDEIFNAKLFVERNIIDVVRERGVVPLNLALHHYYVNYVVKDFKWTGAVVATGRVLKRCLPSRLRRKANFKELNEIVTDNVGWHFSWMGGIDKINEKLDAVCNREYVTENYVSKMGFEERIKNRVTFDFLTDGYEIVLDNDVELPQYLRENEEKFAHLFYKGEKT